MKYVSEVRSWLGEKPKPEPDWETKPLHHSIKAMYYEHRLFFFLLFFPIYKMLSRKSLWVSNYFTKTMSFGSLGNLPRVIQLASTAMWLQPSAPSLESHGSDTHDLPFQTVAHILSQLASAQPEMSPNLICLSP